MSRVRGCVLTLTGTVLLTGCAGAGGEPSASELAATTLADVAQHWSRFEGETRTGEHLAASAVARSVESPGHRSVGVEALDWSGATGTDTGARVLLRITAHVDARNATAVFGSDVAESDEVRCAWFVLGAEGDRHAVRQEDVACSPGQPSRSPRPPVEPQVPSDTQERLEATLAGADAASLRRDVERAFAQDRVTVSTGDGPADDGTPQLVAAVGVRDGTDCVVVVRRGRGVPELVGGLPREWLMPGEVGCSAALVLAPPR